nr:MAG TPA: hypothetical protein [Caudoviricetes sp.]
MYNIMINIIISIYICIIMFIITVCLLGDTLCYRTIEYHLFYLLYDISIFSYMYYTTITYYS